MKPLTVVKLPQNPDDTPAVNVHTPKFGGIKRKKAEIKLPIPLERKVPNGKKEEWEFNLVERPYRTKVPKGDKVIETKLFDKEREFFQFKVLSTIPSTQKRTTITRNHLSWNSVLNRNSGGEKLEEN